MAITTTGSFIQQNSGTNGATATFTVANVGDLCVVGVSCDPQTITITGCSGNNSMGAFSSTSSISDSGTGSTLRLFWAKAGATGSTTITITYGGSGSATGTQIDGWMFTAGLGSSTVWAVDNSQTGTLLTSSSTSINYPSLTATGSGRLYVGYGYPSSTGSAGSTSGFTYNTDSGITNVFCYNPSVSGTVAPTAHDSASGNAIAAAALLTASLPATTNKGGFFQFF